MPRQSRIDAPGALHHVIVRGIERRKIFRDDTDRDEFVGRLGVVVEESGTGCYAWALMPNHVHLLFRTGRRPLATVMRRLLTGYAAWFNRRHRRHGHLFQNRYKSILCQEDRYFLELVRYIHLNPLRAGLVEDVGELGLFPYSGHGHLMGKRKNGWQDGDAVLGLFQEKTGPARRAYRVYVEQGVAEGRRRDLVGGGLVRSYGGWAEIKRLRKAKQGYKGDERILGDTEFVLRAIEGAEEELDRRAELRLRGYDLKELCRRAAEAFAVDAARVTVPGKQREVVKARSVACYWAVSELGMTATEVARKLRISQPAVSIAVRRGEELAEAMNLDLGAPPAKRKK